MAVQTTLALTSGGVDLLLRFFCAPSNHDQPHVFYRET